MKAELTYNLTDLRGLARKHPRIAREEISKVLDIIVTRLVGATVEKTPRGVGGGAGLAGSIHGEVAGRGNPVTGKWGTPLAHGEVVEKGRTAGKRMPPVEPIARWAQRKLGVPADEARSVGFVIARSIAEHGFEGAHMFEEAWDENEAWAQRELRSIPGRVIRRVESGA